MIVFPRLIARAQECPGGIRMIVPYGALPIHIHCHLRSHDAIEQRPLLA